MTLCPYFWVLALGSLAQQIGRLGAALVVGVGVSVAYWYRYEELPLVPYAMDLMGSSAVGSAEVSASLKPPGTG